MKLSDLISGFENDNGMGIKQKVQFACINVFSSLKYQVHRAIIENDFFFNNEYLCNTLNTF